MAKKEFKYRGKSLDELKKLSLDQFAEITTSDFRRKFRRGFTEEEKKLLKKLENKDNVKTHCRTLFVIPSIVGKRLLIHKGNSFEKVLIMPEMIGYRLGEFVMTRKKVQHSSPGVGATRSSSALSVR